jgi:hypothetical protein
MSEADIDELIERSSLGQRGARLVRARAPQEAVRSAVERSVKIETLQVIGRRVTHMSQDKNEVPTETG